MASNTDWVPNPFKNSVQLRGMKKFKFVLMLIFVAPVRFVMFSVFLIISYVLASIAVIGLEDNRTVPLIGVRKKLKDVAVQVMTMYIAVLGIHGSTINGQRAERWEAPILVLAPHTSFFDTFAGIILGAPTFLADEFIFKIPLVGKMLKLATPIIVRRENRDSRALAVAEIKERAISMMEERNVKRGKVWSQLLIFPEGTNGNMTQLLAFRPGAFRTKLPVQPVCIKWSMPYNHISWSFEGPNEAQLIALTACQLETTLTLDLLPVHVPTDADKDEQSGAFLFAKNVRAEMAKHLNLPTSEYTYEDAKLLTRHYKPKRSQFWTLYDSLGLGPPPPNTVEELNLAWNMLKTSNDLVKAQYMVNVAQFAEFLNRDSNLNVQRMFNAFDWQVCGKIDLREYLITLHADPDSLDYIRLIFLMVADEYGMVNEIDFIKMFRFPYEQSIDACSSLYRLVIADDWYPNFARVRLILSKQRDFVHIFLAPHTDIG